MKQVADDVLEKGYVHIESVREIKISSACRKDKPIGNVFGSGLLWTEALDAAADVYNGVSAR